MTKRPSENVIGPIHIGGHCHIWDRGCLPREPKSTGFCLPKELRSAGQLLSLPQGLCSADCLLSLPQGFFSTGCPHSLPMNTWSAVLWWSFSMHASLLASRGSSVSQTALPACRGSSWMTLVPWMVWWSLFSIFLKSQGLLTYGWSVENRYSFHLHAGLVNQRIMHLT